MPGTVLSHDVAYWQHVLMFATSLTARQQFLPNVTQNHEGTQAVWTPLYIGDDANPPGRTGQGDARIQHEPSPQSETDRPPTTAQHRPS